jgi:hypothetical protein
MKNKGKEFKAFDFELFKNYLADFPKTLNLEESLKTFCINLFTKELFVFLSDLNCNEVIQFNHLFIVLYMCIYSV